MFIARLTDVRTNGQYRLVYIHIGRNDGDAASRGSYTLPTQQQYHQQKPSATSLPKGGESPRVFVDGAEVYDSNYGGRTPSPTPEEVDFLTKKGGLSWEKLSNPRWWLQKDVISKAVLFLKTSFYHLSE